VFHINEEQNGMTNLKSILIEEINLNGPMPLSDYIQQCLFHPIYGYYVKEPVFGTDGDFITAPEISQMFGELLAMSILQAWIDQGSPSKIILAELGPGRGTLMADVLRTLKDNPAFLNATEIHLIEASPNLKRIQEKALSGYQISWHDQFPSFDEKHLFLIANEFFDALPIEQFLRKGNHFFKRTVRLFDDKLTYGLEKKPTKNNVLNNRLTDTSDGDFVELNIAAAQLSRNIGTHINSFGGLAILIDYGDWHSLGDTLQAVKSHQYCDIFISPGEVDITAHVDFEILATSSGCAFSKLTTQGVLLERLGITHRAKKISKKFKWERSGEPHCCTSTLNPSRGNG
jgi:SAM-dependent MidA family methyltransferase